MSNDTTTNLFTIKEVIVREDGDGRPIDDEYFVELGDKMVLFTSEAAALEWMAEQDYSTYQQLRDAHEADLIARFNEDQAQYARDLHKYEKALSRYETDRAEVRKLRAQGVPARVAPNPVKPVAPAKPSTTAPTVSKWWYAEKYYEIVPATVIR
ncbi:hypothetical protein ACT17_22630 [Mycolicibacterium conceptionense]|uniref:Uncharacterized protein n=1 Tax=Mycolicibacterium conceptionense TaxID=451644 RepID=A0A0J8U321_9MYCO|nr:hypothetical protein [Mycolicibacterium conceptionense]KMV15906.1 hypothetical protein ACT17_22630 [Mycolicibacterium conceptionense]